MPPCSPVPKHLKITSALQWSITRNLTLARECTAALLLTTGELEPGVDFAEKDGCVDFAEMGRLAYFIVFNNTVFELPPKI